MSSIETEPEHLGIYVDVNASEEIFKLRRYIAAPEFPGGGFTGWQKSSGWSPCEEPINPVHLITGPVLVIGCKEPSGVGAVVVEYETDLVWVGNGTGSWTRTMGHVVAAWDEIKHPVVRSAGIRAASLRTVSS